MGRNSIAAVVVELNSDAVVDGTFNVSLVVEVAFFE